jgi:hypothetical protein
VRSVALLTDIPFEVERRAATLGSQKSRRILCASAAVLSVKRNDVRSQTKIFN